MAHQRDPDELVQQSADIGQQALAITDLNSVAGVVRAAAVGASLLIASGQLQRQHGVVHVLVRRLDDGSKLLKEVPVRSRDFR